MSALESGPHNEPQEVPPQSLREALETIRENEPQIQEWYRQFHLHPELGRQENETAKTILGILNDLGIEVLGTGIGGTGIVARINGRDDGPTVALRADMDALPIPEDQSHNVKSQNEGVSHACGHDTHMAGLLGAAKALKKLADEGRLEGNAMLLFQPSEEKTVDKTSGAVSIVRWLEQQDLRKKIDAVFGLHIMREMERDAVNVKDGTQLASSGEVDIKLQGEGGHIINAYDKDHPGLHRIFNAINLKLDALFRPLYEKNEALVASPRTTYEGKGYNVLPSSAESTWVVRVTSPLYKQISRVIMSDIQQVVEETLAEYDPDKKIKAQVVKRAGYRPIIHRDPAMVDIVERSARQVINGATNERKTLMGGEDFSFYLEELRGKRIPGAFLLVGGANSEAGIKPGPHHVPDFKIDTETIPDLSKLYSAMTLNAFEQFKKKEV